MSFSSIFLASADFIQTTEENGIFTSVILLLTQHCKCYRYISGNLHHHSYSKKKTDSSLHLQIYNLQTTTPMMHSSWVMGIKHISQTSTCLQSHHSQCYFAKSCHSCDNSMPFCLPVLLHSCLIHVALCYQKTLWLSIHFITLWNIVFTPNLVYYYGNCLGFSHGSMMIYYQHILYSSV